MKVLLVYPEYPDTFWSLKHTLRFISKKAAYPPLGLLTVASLLPGDWEKRLIDMNVSSLKDQDLTWADYVFIGAMGVQRSSAEEVIERCRRLGVKTVAGGPLFCIDYDQLDMVDHLVLGEAEVSLPLFLEDLANGHPKHLYNPAESPDLSLTPIPLWDLVDINKYAAMSAQYSRGCPFNCEFCNVVTLNGRVPRTKPAGQLLAEMEALYARGWRGSFFIVDDNFVGNKRKLKVEVLPALRDWMQARRYPFTLITQVSINISDDDELLKLMSDAGFDNVFIGIETPNDESLEECGKMHNRDRDLVECVKKIHGYGIQVAGGFIVGFDSDPPSIFEKQISFIQRSGIATAMVGLLNAPRGTRLYQRMAQENRLVAETTGDNTDCSTNFVPKMPYETLVNGYRKVMSTIYSARPHYERCKVLLTDIKPKRLKTSRLRLGHFKVLLKTMWILGVREEGRRYFWQLVLWTIFRHPRSLGLTIGLQIARHHFFKLSQEQARIPLLRLKPAGQVGQAPRP